LAGIIASWSSALGDMDFATGLGHKDREHRTKVRVGQMVHGLTARSESPRVVPRTIMSRLRAIPAVRTSKRPRGSRPMPGPGTGTQWIGRRSPGSRLNLPQRAVGTDEHVRRPRWPE
jgi:hypothetical protein